MSASQVSSSHPPMSWFLAWAYLVGRWDSGRSDVRRLVCGDRTVGSLGHPIFRAGTVSGAVVLCYGHGPSTGT